MKTKKRAGWTECAAENMVLIEKDRKSFAGTLGLFMQAFAYLADPEASDKLGKVKDLRDYLFEVSEEVNHLCEEKLAEVAEDLKTEQSKV